MTTATDTTTIDPAQLERLARDAHEKLAQCEEREAALAADAYTDPELAAELRSVQHERTSAEAAIRQAQMARAELERRAEAAERARKAAERAEHLQQSRELQAQLRKAAERVDKAAAAFAQSLTAYADLDLELGHAMDRAGERANRAYKSSFGATLMRALVDARTPSGMIELAGIPPKGRRLAENLPEQALSE